MNHLDSATIVTIRDGGLVAGDARLHVDECPPCGAALAEAHGRAERIATALEVLAPERPVDLASAKAAVRARLDRRRDGGRRAWRLPPALGRAAALLVLLAGAVYALPGSPVRSWLRSDSLDPPTPVPAAPTLSEGIEVPVTPAGLTISLGSLGEGTRIEVRWTNAGSASIRAGTGTRYTVSTGRASVDVASDPVVIGIPRGDAPITIEANGRMMLRWADGTLDVSDEAVSQAAEAVVFLVGGA
ncbi:MAG: hypothetical protein OEN56_05465 [Gemmatimonadota bacterium]|nr:hypothetical protein [Gemmatimonadota bacterium]